MPRAQYGDESAVSVGLNNTDAYLSISDPSDKSKGAPFRLVKCTSLGSAGAGAGAGAAFGGVPGALVGGALVS